MTPAKFLFSTEWADILMDFPEEVRHEVYDAVINYVRTGIKPNLKPLAKMAFAFICREIRNAHNALPAAQNDHHTTTSTITSSTTSNTNGDDVQKLGDEREERENENEERENERENERKKEKENSPHTPFKEKEINKEKELNKEIEGKEKDKEEKYYQDLFAREDTNTSADTNTTGSTNGTLALNDNNDILTLTPPPTPSPNNTRQPKLFVKPTLQEVGDYMRSYITSHNLARGAEQAQYFHDYYESNGWRVGRNAMKDWKAAARNWLFRDNNFNSKNNGNNNPYGNIAAGEEQRRRDAEDVIDRLLAGNTVE